MGSLPSDNGERSRFDTAEERPAEQETLDLRESQSAALIGPIAGQSMGEFGEREAGGLAPFQDGFYDVGGEEGTGDDLV